MFLQPVRHALALALVCVSLSAGQADPISKNPYPWQADVGPGGTIRERIAPPRGFQRIPAAAGSFADWLRGLPLKPGRPHVLLHDGRPKKNQEAHFAVIDMDVSRADLQQCADAVIRLRSEYLRSRGLSGSIRWSYTSGDMISFSTWASGRRPVVNGQRVSWIPEKKNDASYESFRRYLENIYTYAGSRSLARDLVRIPFAKAAIGDVFLQAGSPGHAVIVVDGAERGKEKAFLLAQSYMPAQEMHVLRNPGSSDNPWYFADSIGPELGTPEWTFPRESLRRFAD